MHPTHDDPVVTGLSEVVGGPAGTRVGRSRWWTPLRVLLAMTAVVFALGLLSKNTCASREWDPDNPTLLTHVCGSEVADSYTGIGLVELAWPWSGDGQTRQRYPATDQSAGVGLVQYVAARITHVAVGSPDLSGRYQQQTTEVSADPDVAHERVVYVAVTALLLAALALLATWALSRVHPRRPWDAAVFAAAPMLALAGIVSWDLLPVAAVAGALLAWSRGKPVLAGALVGLGVASGVWPVLLLPAFALAALRTRYLTDVVPATISAGAVWVAVNAPAFLTGEAQWRGYWSAATHPGIDEGSLWTVLAGLVDVTPSTARHVAWFLVVLWVLAVAALAVVAATSPRVSQVALLLVGGVLLLQVHYEPQQSLWLLPLAALARPRWRDLLIWQGCEVVLFAITSWWRAGLMTPASDGPPGFYWIAILVHVAGTLWLLGVVVRDVLHAGHDTLREERFAAADAALAAREGDPDQGEAQETTISSNEVAV